MRIAYLAGPANAPEIYRQWSEAERQAYAGTDYMKQFLQLAITPPNWRGGEWPAYSSVTLEQTWAGLGRSRRRSKRPATRCGGTAASRAAPSTARRSSRPSRARRSWSCCG